MFSYLTTIPYPFADSQILEGYPNSNGSFRLLSIYAYLGQSQVPRFGENGKALATGSRQL